MMVQEMYEDKRCRFTFLGNGVQYAESQKSYAFEPINEYGARAAANRDNYVKQDDSKASANQYATACPRTSVPLQYSLSITNSNINEDATILFYRLNSINF